MSVRSVRRKRPPAVAAPVEVRVARRGVAVNDLCGQCGMCYRFARQGEVKGACSVPGADHEYLVCPSHPEWPLCATHARFLFDERTSGDR